ncbi:MAG TPA: hypothetical protein V6C71_04500 [Coleofasciculaceae cyanobacterium]
MGSGKTTLIILLNKTDLAELEVVDRIEDQICQHRSDAKIMRTVKGEVSLPLILSVGLFKSDRYFQEETSHDHHDLSHHHGHHHNWDHLNEDGFTSLFFETEQPLDIRKFQYFIDNQLKRSLN